MSPAWQGLARGGLRASCGIEVTEHVLRAHVRAAAGRSAVDVEVGVPQHPEPDWRAAFRALRPLLPGRSRSAIASTPPSWTDALPLRLPAGGGLEPQLVERARQQLSYEVEEAVLDYDDVETRADGARRVLLFAVPRRRILELLEASESSGFRLEVLESAGTALHRFLNVRGGLDARRTLVVHFDRHHGLFRVLDRSHAYLERALGWGETRLEDAVASRLEVGVEAAGRMLRGGHAAVEDSADEVRSALSEIVNPILRDLVVEVERVLGFCRAEFRDTGIERVLLSGAAAELDCVRTALVGVAPAVDAAIGVTPHGAFSSIAVGLALGTEEVGCAV